MKALLIYIWEFLVSRIPNNYIRRSYFKYILKNAIDENISLLKYIEVTCIGGIDIEKNTTINKGVYLDGRGGVKIGSNVSISPNVKIITASHDVNNRDFKLVLKPVVIEDKVWICTSAIILPGVRVGEGAVVATGSIVTKDVLPYTVVGGNPAKIIASRSKDLSYDPLWRPRFQ